MSQYRGAMEKIYQLARSKFAGNQYLFRLINIFTPEDLVHEFVAYQLGKGRTMSSCSPTAFRHHVINLIRCAYKKHRVCNIHNYTDFDRMGVGISNTYGDRPEGW